MFHSGRLVFGAALVVLYTKCHCVVDRFCELFVAFNIDNINKCDATAVSRTGAVLDPSAA